MDVKIVNHSKYPTPRYATNLSAGMDLNANIDEPIEIGSLERCIIPTGLFIELPQGYEAQIRPRSGLASKFGITVANAPGTIDADYRGEIKVILVNLSKESVTINPGDRIAQMVISKYQKVQWITTEKINETLRGGGGFGSTGMGAEADIVTIENICGDKGNVDIPKLYSLYEKTTGIYTDTRKMKGGGMFFALKGESFNGNDFVLSALDSGAAYAVCDDERRVVEAKEKYPKRVILVGDTLSTLQLLAKYHRLRFKIPVIAITGTNGKTTSKELINVVLSTRYKVVATEGNLNNDIGVPLTLFRIDKDTEMAIVEMGASHHGDIRRLASIVCPSFGVITSIGRAHLQGFGSVEGVMSAKGELFDNLQSHKKIAFVNIDDPLLREMAESRPDLQIVPYGPTNSGARIHGTTPWNPYLRMSISAPAEFFPKKRIKIKSKLIGEYNSSNILVALCIGTYFAIPILSAVKAIASYVPSNNRSQIVKTASKNTLVADTYNANPTSVAVALQSFDSLKAKSKILILGDMLELGKGATKEHKNIIEMALEMQPEALFLIGAEFGRAYDQLLMRKAQNIKLVEGVAKGGSVKVMLFDTTPQFSEYLKSNPIRRSTILIKGSHAMNLESLFDLL